MSSSLPSFLFKLASDPFISEKKNRSDYRVHGIQSQSHGFNAKIGFEKYAPSPMLLQNNCPKSAFQTKPSKFDTFLPISRDSVHIFQNRLLC